VDCFDYETPRGARSRIDCFTASRLFDFANHTRLDQIEAAFAALGKRIAVEVKNAA